MQVELPEDLKKKDFYEQRWDTSSPVSNAQPWNYPRFVGDFRAYVKAMQERSAWCGNLEIAAASAAFETPVVIYQPDAPPMTFGSQFAAPPIFAWYTNAGSSGAHYEWLKGQPAGFDIKKVEKKCLFYLSCVSSNL